MLLIDQLKRENVNKLYEDEQGNLYTIIDFYGAVCVINPQSPNKDLIVLSKYILTLEVEEIGVDVQEVSTNDIILDTLVRNKENNGAYPYYDENGRNEYGYDRDGYREDGSYIL